MTATPPETLRLDRIATPIGQCLLITDDEGYLRVLDFDDYEPRMMKLLRRQYAADPVLTNGAAPTEVRRSIDAYFGGDIHALTAIRWRTGGTDFQRSVWTALTDIPVGRTMSYGELAVKLGNPKAMRAVGLANGANPVGVVVPCHRVIGANGSLTGYGGGIERKRWLLAHEGATLL